MSLIQQLGGFFFSVLADGGVLSPLWQVGGICSLYWQVGGFCLITGREEVLVFLNWQVGKLNFYTFIGWYVGFV